MAAPPLVLLVGSATDPHIRLLKEQLQRKHGAGTVIDPLTTRLRWDCEAGLSVWQGNQHIRIRRPDIIYMHERFTPLLRQISQEEVERFHYLSAAVGFCRTLAGMWHDCLINPPHVTLIYSNKLRQIQICRDLGIPVPETTIVNSVADIRSIVKDGNVVAKYLGHPLQPHVEGDRVDYRTVLTVEVNKKKLSAFPSDGISPLILQKRIPRRREWRIFATRECAYSLNLTCDRTDYPLTDGRIGYLIGRFRRARRTPEAICNMTERFLRATGLRYGVFDMIEDPAGAFWFLECNANGQWANIDHAFDHAVSQHFASYLIKVAQSQD